jgi:DNA-binding protein H-NS
MRAFAASMIALGLFAMPVMAAGGAANNGADPATPKAAADPAAKPTPNAAANTAAAAAPASPAKPAAAEMESELQQLRDAIATQAQQIQDQQKKMQQLEDQLKASSTGREDLSASPAASAMAAPASAGAAASTAATAPVSAAVVATPATAEGNQGGSTEPTSWGFKGVTFTPIGFFAAETVWRQRAMNADVNSPFNSAPLPGNNQYNVSEFNASGRQSRIGMLVQGKLSSVKIGGYYEADFLSAGVTSNDNQSNSYTLRQRQFWAQAAFDSGWTITGGQMWSLVTQTSKGVDPRSEVLPETIDAQYSVGFSWARQYGMRIAKNFNNKMWLAMSVEAPQITFKGAGTTTPFLFGASGTGGGLYNSTTNYSFNETPDFVFKAAFEPGFGHYEVFGLISTFRDRIFPTGLAAYNSSTVGGGGGANAWFPFDHSHVNVGLHVLVGNGIGRYGSAQSAPDVTIQPDGTFATVRSYQGLGTLAFHYPKWDVYFHVGEEYGERTQDPTETVGFGALGFNNAGCWTENTAGSGGYAPGALSNCANNIRDIIEGTAGVWYSFYSGPKGTVKFGLQFSHEAYNTWTGLGNTSGVINTACGSETNPSCAPSTNENMVFTSFRYYIP